GTVFAFYEFHGEAGAPISRQLVDFRSTHHDYKRSLGRRSSRRRPISLPEPTTRPATLSVAQVGNLIRACEHRRDRLLIGFWWLAGLRVGQTLGLRHDDIDALKALLRIVPRTNPNGARPKVRETKTVPLRQELLDLYGEYVREELHGVDSDYVFVNLWGAPLGSPMTYSAVDGLVRRLRAQSGVDFTPHQLRHTFATDLHREGVSLEVISRLLTHRSISTTSDLYLHLEVEDLRAGLEMAKGAGA
ncbi:MAG: tyrosine-type recombinase/integrase, partial [Candidatus Microthrix parvicella]